MGRPSPPEYEVQKQWLDPIFERVGARHGLTGEQVRMLYMQTFRRVAYHMRNTVGPILLPGLGKFRPVKYRIEATIRRYLYYRGLIYDRPLRKQLTILFKARRYNDWK